MKKKQIEVRFIGLNELGAKEINEYITQVRDVVKQWCKEDPLSEEDYWFINSNKEYVVCVEYFNFLKSKRYKQYKAFMKNRDEMHVFTFQPTAVSGLELKLKHFNYEVYEVEEVFIKID
jgi:hypothetical protein